MKKSTIISTKDYEIYVRDARLNILDAMHFMFCKQILAKIRLQVNYKRPRLIIAHFSCLPCRKCNALMVRIRYWAMRSTEVLGQQTNGEIEGTLLLNIENTSNSLADICNRCGKKH